MAERAPLAPGSYRLGPHNARLEVRTFRAGLASKAGHDLVIEVLRWRAGLTVAEGAAGALAELSADPRSFAVREGHGGAKPLSARDRAEIERNVVEKVLGERSIEFRSTRAERSGEDRLRIGGELEIAGRTREVDFELRVAADGHVEGGITLEQSRWGIEPYSALMGALRVSDSAEVTVAGRLGEP